MKQYLEPDVTKLRNTIKHVVVLMLENRSFDNLLGWLYADQGLVAYGRRLGASTLVVLLNNGPQPATLNLPVRGYLDDGQCLRDVWGDSVLPVVHGQVSGIHLPARSGLVLEPVPQAGC